MEEKRTESKRELAMADSKIDYFMLASLSHLSKLKEKELESINNQIAVLKKEVNLLQLERKWCYDRDGKRIVPTCEEQALEISKQLSQFPHLTEDVVKALRKKSTDLDSNLTELNAKCNSLKDRTIHL